MKIQLSDHFTYKKLIRFTLPSIAMMIFTSIYGVVDGFFVSNFAGKTPFAAVNLIMPFLMILGAFGFMFGAGGSALRAGACQREERAGVDRTQEERTRSRQGDRAAEAQLPRFHMRSKQDKYHKGHGRFYGQHGKRPDREHDLPHCRFELDHN